MTTKITDANIDSDKQDNNAFNISLLGFKMAVNEGLTVFNLVDGVVDEFNDESGTDEAEGSNDYYCGTSDFYQNFGPTGSPVSISAGFTTTSITEPDTSTTGTNPSYGCGTMGQFTVPSGLTSVSAKVWGAGGSGGNNQGGGGGFVSGCLAVTPGQTLYVLAGEGAAPAPQNPSSSNSFRAMFFGGAGANFNPVSPYTPLYGAGGGIAAISNFDMAPIAETAVSGTCLPCNAQLTSPTLAPTYAPQLFLVAGAGGGAPIQAPAPYINYGGAGGGLTGNYGGGQSEQTAANPPWHGGGGGDQEQGGQAFANPGEEASGRTTPGGFLYGGVNIATSGEPCAQQDINIGSGGGAGYYGGGGGAKTGPGGPGDPHGHGGGGSSYYGHPQITSGATEDGGDGEGGGASDPAYVACTNEAGEDGYVLLVGSADPQATSSTTIVSEPFTSTSVPTSSRIVVFEENIDTPTLNTDIIASVSRDGGSTFTNATLSDSGYVTGSSGQRILTGQADISGQPSGQSMRWKLALANNAVKIHGVSLQWS